MSRPIQVVRFSNTSNLETGEVPILIVIGENIYVVNPT